MINIQKLNYTEETVSYIQKTTNFALEKGFILIELIFKGKTPQQIINEFNEAWEMQMDTLYQINEGYRQ